MNEEEEKIEQLNRFLQVAPTGRRGTASSGERSAYLLAMQVRALGELLMDVDDDLRRGFCQALLVAAHPDTRSIVLSRLP